MNSNTRLIVNTLAQNIRTFINIVLSLYSTRIVMQALGQSDYGIYMLVAGIVSLLSYLNNTLVITTQRHLSFAYGSDNDNKVKEIFANSYMLHWLIGVGLAICCLALTSWIFNGQTLDIPANRLHEAKVVYYMVIFSVVCTFITSPFRALLIAHENIVYISVIEILDGVLKLSLVFTLFLIDDWRLALYSIILAGVMLFNFVMLSGYCISHYKESSIIPRITLWSNAIQREIINFATWTLYGMICIYIRNQGIAVVLNKIFGTIANSAYGIATQIQGAFMSLSEAILNASKPQIFKAEGQGDSLRSYSLALAATKYTYLIILMMVIPIIFEMESVLRFWLGEVPQYAFEISTVLLLSILADQLTLATTSIASAKGKIRTLYATTFTIKAFVVVIFYAIIKAGGSLYWAMFSYLGVELLVAVLRLPLIKRVAKDFSIRSYWQDVISKVCVPTICAVICAYLCTMLPLFSGRFIITGLCTTIAILVSIWLTSLSDNEKNYILTRIKNIANK